MSGNDAPAAAAAAASDGDHLNRLRRFYQKYDPTRVPHAEITLKTWKGSESVMWSKLTAKYGPEPEEQEMTQMNMAQLAAATMAAQRLNPNRNKGGSLAAASSPTFTDNSFKKRLQRFYAMYAPHRLDTVDKALEVFRGREEDLFASLRRKYGEEPAEDFPIPDSAATNSPSKGALFSRSFGASQNTLSAAAATGDAAAVAPTNAPYPNGASTAAQMDTDDDDDFGQDTKARSLGRTAQSGEQAPPSQSNCIDWENACSGCIGCTEALGDCLKSRAMNKFYTLFYPIVFGLAIIGAIVTALVAVGLDRNKVAFKQTKSSSELDTSQLYFPGIYSWGVNTRALDFPSNLQRVFFTKSVICCGGQTLTMGETFYWSVIDPQTKTANITELASMVRAFGNVPVDKMIVAAKEAFSDSIAKYGQNLTLDEFLDNRTALTDAVHAGLTKELRKNGIYVQIPRSYYSLDHIRLPSTFLSQKIQVFSNNQSVITAGFTADATSYRLGTQTLINDIDANTSLVIATANSNATRLRNIATSTNAALNLQNIANSIAEMLDRVNATSAAAGIDLFRLNELLDMVEDNSNIDFFVSIKNGAAFPLI